MLDALTDGRIVAGMLRGTPNEYVTYDINPSESRERFEEALQLIRRCWTETQPFGWQGRHFRYRSISIWPRPVQRPHPPIYMSGSTPEAAEFAARQHVNGSRCCGGHESAAGLELVRSAIQFLQFRQCGQLFVDFALRVEGGQLDSLVIGPLIGGYGEHGGNLGREDGLFQAVLQRAAAHG